MMGNPTGGAVVAGSATIGSAGPTLTINQSTQNAIINWQQFSIASGETTKYIVPNSSSATLNRVTGGNPSAIYGTLQSNGILYLVNPSGIVVGPGGRIDTASFLASTLDVSNQQFLAGGNLNFTGASNASIDNEGAIHASTGDVYLIANQVNNNGTVTAPQGNVGMAAGSDVLFQQAGSQHLFVQATPAGTSRATGVTNAGTIRAAAAELKAAGGNAYALAINNTGAIAATGYKKVNGQVYLTADGGNITNSGQISAQTATGNGGTVVLNGHGTSSTGTVLNSGKLLATGKTSGKTGGTVEVLGNRVGITGQGVVDVSGDAGGGTALIGGDQHGANPAIADADQTYLGPDAVITADALTLGMGGKVILWGNKTTQAYGQISAKGGAQGGNGGFVETSGASLDLQTAPNISAPHGKGGTWLLDPSAVTIDDQAGDTNYSVSSTAPFAFTPTGDSVTINQTTLQTELASGSVVIDAGTGSGSLSLGTITWTQTGLTPLDISLIPGNTLTLSATGQIFLNGVTIEKITSSATGSLNLILNSATSSGNVTISNSNITLNSGNFTAYGAGLTASTGTTNLDGIDILNSTINTDATIGGSGNIYFNGQAGYSSGSGSVDGGIGVFLNGATLQTTPAGNITVIGTSGFTASVNGNLEGVEIEGGSLSTVDGLLSIQGTVNSGAATGTLVGSDSGNYVQGGNIFGVVVGNGATIQSTGNGSVSIIGYINPTLLSPGVWATSATQESIGVYLTGGIGNTTGSDAGDVSTSGSPTTTLITVAGGPGSGNPGITITGTSGTVNNSLTGTNVQTPNTDGLLIQNGVSVTASNSATIALTGTGGVDANTGLEGVTNENSEGIEMDTGNYGNGAAPNVTIQSAGGDITLIGTGGSSVGSVDGISLNSSSGGSVSITSSAANISLIGSDPNQTAAQSNSTTNDGGDTGVNIGGGNSTGSVSSVTASAGSIYINGTVSSGSANSKEAGVVLSKGSTVTASGTGGSAGVTAQGDVTIVGDTTGSTAQSLDAGVFIEGSGTQVSASGIVADAYGGTGLTITGTSSSINGSTGGTINENNGAGGYFLEPFTAGIAIGNGAMVTTLGSAPMTLNGTGGNNDNTLNSDTGYADPTTGATSASYGVAIFSPIAGQTSTISSGGNLFITGAAGSSPTTGIGVMLGGPSNAGAVSVTSAGAITLVGTGGAGNSDTGVVPNSGVGIFNPGNIVNGTDGNPTTGGTANVSANGGDLTITGTAGAGGSTGVDMTYYDSPGHNSSYDPGLNASGNISVTALAGGIKSYATENAPNIFFSSTPGTSSNIQYIGYHPLSPLSLSGGDFSVTELFNAVQWGTANVTNLSITEYDSGTPHDTNLGAITTGNLTITTLGNININGPINAAGTVTIQNTSGNITIGSGGSISDSGTGNNVILAAGTNLTNAHYIINNSTAGSNAVQVSGGAFYLYSSDPTGDAFGGITAPAVYGATYPATGLPTAPQELFFVAAAGDVGPGGPPSSSPPSTTTGGADGGGSNIVPPALVPQPTPPVLLPPGSGTLGSTPPPPPISFTGNGTSGLTGQQDGGLANSSSNGGQVGSGDAAQIGNGGVNNVTNPQAAGALNQALGPVVFHNLQDALKDLGDFAAADLPGSSDDNTAGGGGQETILSGGEVAEIGGKGVKNIPLAQAPPQLQNALGGGVLSGMPAGAGH
jgi:filamentous hemagglutinin family protein